MYSYYTIQEPNSCYLIQINKNLYSHRNPYTNLSSRFICNSPKLKILYMSFNEWLFKQTTAYPYNGILFSNKKEQAIDMHNKVDEFSRNYAEWKRANLHKVTYYMILLI